MLLGRLFEALFAGGVTLVATSNSAPDNLYHNGLNRQLFLPFIALLKDRTTVLELRAVTDYRHLKLAGQTVFAFGPPEATRPRMDAMWRHMTDNAAGAPGSVHSLGRDIPVPLAAAGVARFRLCRSLRRPARRARLPAAGRAVRGVHHRRRAGLYRPPTPMPPSASSSWSTRFTIAASSWPPASPRRSKRSTPIRAWISPSRAACRGWPKCSPKTIWPPLSACRTIPPNSAGNAGKSCVRDTGICIRMHNLAAPLAPNCRWR